MAKDSLRLLPRLALVAALVLAATFTLIACDDDDDGNDNGESETPAATSEGGLAGGGEAGTPTVEAEPTEPPPAGLTDSNLQMEEITGVTQPTQMIFLAPNDILVAEKTGNIVRVTDGQVAGPVAELAANYHDERGVLGITKHPDFEQNNYVYVYWTWTGVGDVPDGLFGEASDDPRLVAGYGNRVDRFVWDGQRLNFDRNIAELPALTTTVTTNTVRGNHNAGVIKFGPDGKLYVVIGDQNFRGDLTNVEEGPDIDESGLLGVVLRLNDDGSVPQDNPFVAEGELASKIFMYGIRNSFGFDFDPQEGNFWLQTNGQASYDEIGMYDAGDNSGWIQLRGPNDRFDDYKSLELDTERLLDNPSFPPSRLAENAEEAQSRLVMLPGAEYKEPLFAWRFAVAPTDVEFIEGTALGADYDGNMLVGDVNTGTIYRFRLTDDRTDFVLDGGLDDRVNDNTEEDPIGELSEDYIFARGIMVATDIETSPDGSLWISSLAENALYHITAAQGAPQ